MGQGHQDRLRIVYPGIRINNQTHNYLTFQGS
jgi:hypothetical protein